MRARSSGIKPNRLSVALFAALALPVAGTAFAQDAADQEEEQATAAPAQASEETTELDRVTVTGSRIKRAEIEGPAPVTIITAEDPEQQGSSTVYDRSEEARAGKETVRTGRSRLAPDHYKKKTQQTS